MPIPPITIASYQLAHELLGSAAGMRFKHVISINNPDEEPPRTIGDHPGRHLFLEFHDVTREHTWGDATPPTRRHLERVVEFAGGILPDEPVLVHCAAGVSRSSAAALAVIASRLEPSEASATRAYEALLEAKQAIRPNEDMVAHTDQLLGYDGHLVRGWNRLFGGHGSTIWMPPSLADLEPDDFDR